MASPVTATTAFQPAPYAAPGAASAAIPPQSALNFGSRIQDSIRFSGKEPTEGDAEIRKEKSGHSIKDRFSAATADAFNIGQMFWDGVWATLFGSIIAIGALPFVPIVIPTCMAATAAYRGLRAFVRGEPIYAEKGFSMPDFLKRNKDKAPKESE